MKSLFGDGWVHYYCEKTENNDYLFYKTTYSSPDYFAPSRTTEVDVDEVRDAWENDWKRKYQSDLEKIEDKDRKKSYKKAIKRTEKVLSKCNYQMTLDDYDFDR